MLLKPLTFVNGVFVDGNIIFVRQQLFHQFMHDIFYSCLGGHLLVDDCFVSPVDLKSPVDLITCVISTCKHELHELSVQSLVDIEEEPWLK